MIAIIFWLKFNGFHQLQDHKCSLQAHRFAASFYCSFTTILLRKYFNPTNYQRSLVENPFKDTDALQTLSQYPEKEEKEGQDGRGLKKTFLSREKGGIRDFLIRSCYGWIRVANSGSRLANCGIVTCLRFNMSLGQKNHVQSINPML